MADDVLPLMKTLKQHHPQVLLGGLSNSDPKIIAPLRDLGIVPHYIQPQHVITSWAEGYAKPDPRIYATAVQHIGAGIALADVLMVGDDLHE